MGIPAALLRGATGAGVSQHTQNVLTWMQAMHNQPERCHVNHHHRKPSVHNKEKEPILKETNVLSLVSSGVAYSSPLNYLLKKKKKLKA